jgi:4-hydroxymandelate oxidase
MRHPERRWASSLTRRAAFRGLAGFLAGSPLLRGQLDPFRDHSRVPSMDELKTAFDFEAICFAKMPRDAYDFMAYGSDGEFTLRRNRQVFDWVKLIPRGVVNVSSVNTATEVLGTKMAFPILVAPTSYQMQLHPEGELAMRRGATGASATPMIVSNASSFPFEKIAEPAGTPLWYQLYAQEDFEETRRRVESGQAAGARAVALTVDQQSASYERAGHARHLGNPRVTSSRANPRAGGRQAAAPANPYRISGGRLWQDWRLVEKLRPVIKVPFLAKGILTAEDAKLCVENGLDGVIVSNHGARSLDYGPSTLEVLPEIVDAVQGRIPVLIDSGFRRGTDVLKALALGAKAVCLGRAARWGLGAYGQAGAQRVLEIIQAELVLAMAHTGRPTLASIDRTLVRTDFS